jgi:hypothetical protein
MVNYLCWGYNIKEKMKNLCPCGRHILVRELNNKLICKENT